MAARQGVQKYFFYIKQKVAADWKDLAHLLGFDKPDIGNIEGRNRDDRSRCMDMLEEWKKRNGNAATIGVLMEALSEAGQQDVLHGLKNKYPELATQQETGGQPQRQTALQPQQNRRGQPVSSHHTTQPKQATRGQPPSGQPQYGATEQPMSSHDTTQPTQETWDQSYSDTSRQPQQETAGASSTGEATYASDCPVCPNGPKKLFIVHSGEDKDSLVDPLAHEIVGQGVPMEHVFYDKWSIGYTQGIKQSINSAIQDSCCKLAVVVLSEDMMKKYWPRKEIEDFLMRRIRFFPIFYGVEPEEVRKDYSPTLADKRGVVIPKTGCRVDDNLIAGTASSIRKILRDL
ncbi:uncharacterized protein LOC118404031 [Branchiostoma floridae]|uniref:Uncharacterized protein LOC118404031 n=1 Tax=Branchiostoma floridae TaxID=7739 RepID=A0A9J7HGE0_BRAFL|nr:uncharacterized protein LOC118404031 [Branchiostoma floridae]